MESKKARRSIKPLLLTLIIVAFAGYYLFNFSSIHQYIDKALKPKEMAMREYSPKNVHANLGGLEVKIPYYYAEFVEFDGDPDFGKMRKGEIPKRTPESKIRSFGFPVRYPDMTGLSTPKIRIEKRKQSLKASMWMRVSVTSGQFFPGTGFLDRNYKGTLNPSVKSPLFIYEKLPEQQFGLDVYVNPGYDPKTLYLYRDHEYARDVFFHQDSNGSVNAMITCINKKIETAQCRLKFSLEPEAKVAIDVVFRRGLLPNWQDIKGSVKDLLLSFAV